MSCEDMYCIRHSMCLIRKQASKQLMHNWSKMNASHEQALVRIAQKYYKWWSIGFFRIHSYEKMYQKLCKCNWHKNSRNFEYKWMNSPMKLSNDHLNGISNITYKQLTAVVNPFDMKTSNKKQADIQTSLYLNSSISSNTNRTCIFILLLMLFNAFLCSLSIFLSIFTYTAGMVSLPWLSA